MTLTNNISFYFGYAALISFLINIIVQMTKQYIKIPTKLWCIIISGFVNLSLFTAFTCCGYINPDVSNVVFTLFGSFLTAYISMYGFDTFKNLWQRFKNGENINK